MKNFKILSVAMIFMAIVLMVATSVFAYAGVGDVDPEYKISMPSSLSNGEGSVSGVSGNISYQFVEISEAKYATIKKLEAQYDLIEVYVSYAANPTDEGLTNKYNTACDKYEAQYGKGSVTEVLSHYGVDAEILTLCRNEWIAELTDFNASNWETSNGNKISIDLSTFEGTKYFIGWIKTADGIYDAEAYQVTGTKVEDQEPNKDPAEEPDKKPTNTNDNTPSTKTENTTKKADNTTTSKTIPKTGISSTLLVLLSLAGASTGVSYIKYRKIK
ncbi:MAG: hypothetical protein HFJ35_01705 [Clostridia bacterium]|nr:hypothetical protein [Clostridia bacterium]